MIQFLQSLFTPRYKVYVSLEIAEDVWVHRVFTLPFVPFHHLTIEDADSGSAVIYDDVRITDRTAITWNTHDKRFECFGEWAMPLGRGPRASVEQMVAELQARGWTSK